MNPNDMRMLYAYNRWANRRILHAVEQVTAEQLTSPAPFPMGSLRGTLVHALGAEWLWRLRWQGNSPAKGLNEEDFPDAAAIRSRWDAEEHALGAFVQALTDEDLLRPVHYRLLSGREDEQPLWQLMQHVALHGMQHRAEAAAILTSYGCSPGDIDLLIYLRDNR